MNRVKTFFLIGICQFVILSLNAQIQGLTTIIKKVDPSIIKIYTINSNGEYERQGTGIIISTDGIGVTNFHVLAGAKKAEAINFEGEKFEIKTVIDYSEKNDLIKIQLVTNGKTTSPVTFSNLNLEKGMNVFTLGFPNGFEISGGSTVSTGIISGFRNLDGQDLIQTTAPITHGSSGGGLFNEYGKLCGITSGTFASDIKDRHANLNKVIPTSDIKYLTRNLNISLFDFYNIISNDNLFIKAMEAYESDNFENAVYYFVEHLRKFPDDAVAWFRLGNCYNQIGRKTLDISKLEKAIEFINYSIELDNTYFSAYGQGALIYIMLGKNDLALEYATMGFNIAPKVGFNSYILGYYYIAQGNYINAIEYLTNAIELASAQERLFSLHQWYLERAGAYSWLKKDTLAENDYKKCLELNSSNQDCLFYYSNFLLLRERKSEACIYFNKLYKLNPTYSNGGDKVTDYINSFCE